MEPEPDSGSADVEPEPDSGSADMEPEPDSSSENASQSSGPSSLFPSTDSDSDSDCEEDDTSTQSTPPPQEDDSSKKESPQREEKPIEGRIRRFHDLFQDFEWPDEINLLDGYFVNPFPFLYKRQCHPCRTFNNDVAHEFIYPEGKKGKGSIVTFQEIIFKNFAAQTVIEHCITNSLFLCINWAMPLVAYLLHEDLTEAGLGPPPLTLGWIQKTQQELVDHFANLKGTNVKRNGWFNCQGCLKEGQAAEGRQKVFDSVAFKDKFGVNIKDSANRLQNLLEKVVPGGTNLERGKLIECLKWSDRIRPSVAVVAVKANVCHLLTSYSRYYTNPVDDIKKIGEYNIGQKKIPGVGYWYENPPSSKEKQNNQAFFYLRTVFLDKMSSNFHDVFMDKGSEEVKELMKDTGLSETQVITSFKTSRNW